VGAAFTRAAVPVTFAKKIKNPFVDRDLTSIFANSEPRLRKRQTRRGADRAKLASGSEKRVHEKRFSR